MIRGALAVVVAALALAGCGSSNSSAPPTPTIAAAQACLTRSGLSAVRAPAAALHSLSSRKSAAPAPVAELSLVPRDAAGTHLLAAYFATSAAATLAAAGDFARIMHGIGRAAEVSQAVVGKHRGRVLLIELNPKASDQGAFFKARYCTIGVRVPTPQTT